MRIISDRTPNGNSSVTLSCGDLTNYNWRAAVVGAMPPGGELIDYSWGATGVMQLNCCATTPAPVITSTGNPGTGTVTLSVRYRRNGAVSPPIPVTVNITVSQNLAIPSISLSLATPGYPSLVCRGETFTAQVSGQTGITYTWSGSPGVNIVLLTPTGDRVQVTINANAPDGNAYIAATPNSSISACGPPRKPASVALVIGKSFPEPNSFPLMVGTDYGPNYATVSCGTPTWLTVAQPRQDAYGNTFTNFEWDVDGVRLTNYANQFQALASFLPASQGGGQVTLIVTNRCGQKEYYYWEIPVSNTCSGGPISPQPCDCGRVAVYPNPADTELTVEQERGSVALRNGQGRVVFAGRPVQGRLVIDTRPLPAGLYYLEHQGESGGSTRRQISIQH